MVTDPHDDSSGNADLAPKACPPVFISHSSADAAAAVQVTATLEAAGIPCWIAPRDIPFGAEYNAAIMDALNRCRALILVYSRHSAASDAVLREVERAVNRKVAVMPVRIENMPVSQGLEYLISTRQWINALPPPVDRHLPMVLGEVQRSLGMQTERPAAADEVPDFIGPYRVLGVLGEGGMGTVYRAEQRAPIKRTVGLKLIKAGFDTKEVIARFESERQALARMDHPHVAKVLDAGADSRGRPYFVMEFIPGKPITEFADEQRLTVRQRLELFVQVCEAVAHAHTKGLIHRDIKATNVLAYLADGQACAKVIDFGVAKALTGDRLTDRTLATELGAVVGTYDSMSPEQAAGSADIDTRSDVYSLGSLLYELLTGSKPFDDATLSRAADEEKRRIIREVEPPRPSTRISKLGKEGAAMAAARREKLDALAAELRSELEWVPLKALRKERDRRYATPLALAEDIQNYLAGLPLVAAPESRLYRLRKWTGRNRVALATSAAFVILLAAAVGTYIYGIRAEQARTALARDEAVRQKDIANNALVATEEAKKQADRSAEIARTQKNNAEKARIAAEESKKQAEANARTARTAKNNAEKARMSAEDAKKRADANAEMARTQARLSLQIINSVIFDIQRGLQIVPGALEVRRQILKTAIDGLNQVVRFSQGSEVDRDTAAALEETGDVLIRLGGSEKDAVSTARRFYEQANVILRKLADADPRGARAQRDLSISYDDLGDVTLQMGQTAAALKHYQDGLAVAKKLADANPRDAQAQRDLSISYNKLGNVTLQMGQIEAALKYYQDSLAVKKKLADADPRDAQAQRDLSVSYEKLGDVTLQMGQTDAALNYYQDGLAVTKKLADADPRDSQAQRDLSVSYEKLGDVTLRMGQTDAALKYYRDDLAVAKKLADADPRDAQAQRDLSISYERFGTVTLRTGQTDAALKYCQQRLAIAKKLADADPRDAQAQRDLFVSYEKLGDVTRQMGQTDAALKYYQGGFAISKKLAENDPRDAQAQRSLFGFYVKLGDVTLQIGQTDAALKYYQGCLAIAKKQADAGPRDAHAQGNLSVSYERLGDATLQIGQTDAALKYYHQHLAVATKLADADPRDAQAQRDLSISYDDLGDVTLQMGQTDAALRYYLDGLAVAKKLADAGPRDAQAQRDLFVSYERLGNVTLQMGQTDAAQKYYQDGLAVVKKLADADPRDAQAQRNLSTSYEKLGKVTLQMGQTDAALKYYQDDLAICKKLAESDPNNAQARNDLNWVTRRMAYCNDAAIALAGLDSIDSSKAERRPWLLYVRCAELGRRGDLSAAAEAADRLRHSAGKDAVALYNAACSYSLCVRILETPPVDGTFRLGAKPRELTAERKAQRQKYIDLALAALKDAIAAGYRNAEQIRADTDLIPVRGLPEFQRLIGSIPAKAK